MSAVSQALLRLLSNEARASLRDPSGASRRDPHYPRRPLTARGLVLTEATRQRGGAKSRRRTARVWKAR